CTSGDELVKADTAPYMTNQETLQIDVSYWWAPEEGYQIDTVRMYLAPSTSLTVDYCYYAAAANVVTDTTYNMRKGNDVPSVDPVPPQEPTAPPVSLMASDTLAIADRTKTGGYTYENGILTVESKEASGYNVTLTPNVTFKPEELKRWLINVEANVRFDIELLVTTADGDRTFSLRDDFYTHFTDTPDGDYIPAMTGSAGLDFLGCYTYNQVLPTDGNSTVKKVTIRVGGVGTVVIDEIQLAANDVLISFADGAAKSDSTPDVTYERGDADQDGAVDTTDVRAMLFFAVDDAALTAVQLATADYDADGVVTTSDARALLMTLTV
ncbi:MAG: hypothetical protein IJC52_04705, partial [Clostridia bacterium]|nr:hypothetical protein [Clostridia bacterium]